MKTNNYFLLAITIFSVSIFSSCDPETEVPIPIDTGYEGKGVFMISEGNFGTSNSTIDYFQTSDNKVIEDIFNIANTPLKVGSSLQSFTTYKGKGYMVLNGTAVVKVVSLKDFKIIAEITGFSSPRYITLINEEKAYVSDWGTNSIQVVNLKTNKIESSIPTGKGPEQMLLLDNVVLVANSGGFINDTKISIINYTTNTVIGSKELSDKPTAIQKDADGKIWVLCSGNANDFTTTDDDTQGKLYKLNGSNYEVEKSFDIGIKSNHPDRLAIDATGKTLFYTGSYEFGFGIRKHNISANALVDTAFINGNFYSLGIDKKTNVLFAGDAKNFSQKGEFNRFNISDGKLINKIACGISPIGIQIEQ